MPSQVFDLIKFLKNRVEQRPLETCDQKLNDVEKILICSENKNTKMENSSATAETSNSADVYKKVVFEFINGNDYFIPTLETIPIDNAIEFVFNPQWLVEKKWRDKIIAACVTGQKSDFTYTWGSELFFSNNKPQTNNVSVIKAEDSNMNSFVDQETIPFSEELVKNCTESMVDSVNCDKNINIDITNSNSSLNVSLTKPTADVTQEIWSNSIFSKQISPITTNMNTTDVMNIISNTKNDNVSHGPVNNNISFSNKNNVLNNATSCEDIPNLSPVNTGNIVSTDVAVEKIVTASKPDYYCKNETNDTINNKVRETNVNNSQDMTICSTDFTSNEYNDLSSKDSSDLCSQSNVVESNSPAASLYTSCTKISTNVLKEIARKSIEENPTMKESVREKIASKALAFDILNTETSVETATVAEEPELYAIVDKTEVSPELSNEPVIESYISATKNSIITEEIYTKPLTLRGITTEAECAEKPLHCIPIDVNTAEVPNKQNKLITPSMEVDHVIALTADVDSVPTVFCDKLSENINEKVKQKHQIAKELSDVRAKIEGYYDTLERETAENVSSAGFLKSTRESLEALKLLDLGFLKSGGLAIFHHSELCTEIDRIANASWKSSETKNKQ